MRTYGWTHSLVCLDAILDAILDAKMSFLLNKVSHMDMDVGVRLNIIHHKHMQSKT